MGNPATNQLKRGTLKFCGIAPVKVTYIAPVNKSSEQFRLKQLEKVKKLGKKLL